MKDIANGILLKKIDYQIQHLFAESLRKAMPNRHHKYRLAKMLIAEGSSESISHLYERIERFYQIDFYKRTDKVFIKLFSVRPYLWLRNQFYLNFRNAEVSITQIYKISVSIKHCLESNLEVPCTLSEEKLLLLVVLRICQPDYYSTLFQVSLFDFLNYWRQCVFKKYGNKYEYFFDFLQKQIDESLGTMTDIELDKEYGKSITAYTCEQVLLKQADYDWLVSIREAIIENSELPFYPLQRGAQVKELRNLENIVKTLRMKREKSNKNSDAIKLLTNHLFAKATEIIVGYDKTQYV